MAIYITAIDKKILAHAWIEATRLYGAMRDAEWYEKYHTIYTQMFEGIYDYEQAQLNFRLARLSLEDVRNKDSFVMVDYSDERLIAARGRLEDFIEEKPNESYAVDWRDSEENSDLDMLDTD